MDKNILIEKLKSEISDVKPYPIIGDDDTIYLTSYQEGVIRGLEMAIEAIKKY